MDRRGKKKRDAATPVQPQATITNQVATLQPQQSSTGTNLLSQTPNTQSVTLRKKGKSKQLVQNVAPIAPISATTAMVSQPVATGDDDTKSTESSEKDTGELRRGTTARSKVSMGGGIGTPDQRGRTEVGPQVEHASAYVLFEELLYAALEGERFATAPKTLAESFACLPLPEKAIKEISEKAEKVEEEFVPRDERKKTTRTLRGVNDVVDDKDFMQAMLEEKRDSINSTLIEKQKAQKLLAALEKLEKTDPPHIKEAIMLANRSKFASAIAPIIDDCIFGANKMPYASLPIEGVDPNPNTGKERTAKNNLKLLSDFLLEIEEANNLKQDSDPEKQQKWQEKIEELKQDTSMLRDLNKTWGIDNSQANDLIEAKADADSIFGAVRQKILEHVGELFYYPRLTKTYEYSIDGDTKKWAVSKEDWDKVIESKKYNKGTNPRSNDHEILGQLAGRHLVLIFNCFKGLSTFSPDNQARITQNFIEKSVLDDNGWKDEKINTSHKKSKTKQKDIMMDSPYLENKIEMHAILDYRNCIFYTKGSAIEQQQNTSKSQGMSPS